MRGGDPHDGYVPTNDNAKGVGEGGENKTKTSSSLAEARSRTPISLAKGGAVLAME